ncbi:PREDICTED: uncharacterized protein LOC105148130 [Acromyrmex echinatior]|uniref:uncharacterized protein LOC105148130 n=1 Tax=Acromyrmex echinatior TaxID=103372 RepID=UPI000580EF1C|nr:PREDICTED: uncharacterized protein LOC105148130 [Acromyrmex echinatior]
MQVLGIIEIWSDSLEVIDCLPMLVLSTVSISKLICAIYTLSEIKILLTRMRQYWYSPKSDEETRILLSYALYGKKLSYVYTGELFLSVITSTEDVNHLLKHTSYLSALLLNTFVENWQGQKIIDSSEKVYESAYNAEWYKMPIAQRKLFIMIMMKSRKSLKITAGNFVNLSYVNFNAVSKTIA